MKKYIIKKVNNSFDWDSIPKLEVSEIMWLKDAGIRMSQQICYDSEAIYVHQVALENNIRAEEKDFLSAVCNDSCMEFFFDFECDGRYFNFEINPIGTIYLGFGKERATRLRIIDKNPAEHFSIKTTHTLSGWDVYYKIPLTFVRLFYPEYQFVSGKSFKANCYKCGDKTDTPHYLAWNTLSSDTPDFHRAIDFGIMTFE
ncbi:MAG: carbohydrate-binding family 9-like protein [Bacillota bacterium]|nr:carbohydrate-binding family 9-like protein [Bacillota bacterium]